MADNTSSKGTRSSIACIACRARKHRCSGEKPRCAKCKSRNVSCEWPAQHKRGPPKQYTHILEARLLATERVLLSLLPHVSAEQLQASFRQMPPNEIPLEDQMGKDSDESSMNRRDLFRPSHWNSFPLNSPENVQRWWDHRLSLVPGLPPAQSPNDDAGTTATLEDTMGLNQPGDSRPFYGIGDTGPELAFDTSPGAQLVEKRFSNGASPLPSGVEYVPERAPGTEVLLFPPLNEEGGGQFQTIETDTRPTHTPDANAGSVLNLSNQFQLDYIW